jgi:tripeptide aminopeptidase
MINRERMTNAVLDLLRLDSHSKEEKPVADYLVGHLRELGCDVQVDEAGKAVNSSSGNILARLHPTSPSGAPLLLSSHMDVVPPGRNVKPIRESDRIRSDGTTILGGDDKTGLAIILEVLRSLKDHNVAHGPVEVAFTICEEIGLLGAKHIDYASLRSKEAIVLDSDRATQLVTRAPSADRYVFRVHGLEAHAGLCPENGISAVRVAAEAIAAMPIGRVDAQSTANVVILEGPTATNVVPNLCVVRGEARSLDDARLDEVMRSIRAAFADAAARAKITLDGQVHRAWIEEQCSREYYSFHVPDDAPIVRLVQRSAQIQGSTVETVTIGGGSDANVFNRNGIASVNLGTGMRDIHTVKEWIDLSDFYRGAEIVLGCVKERAAA